MDDIRTGLSYGDVLLVPQRSPVDSRRDVDLSTRLADDLALENPLLSAPMDTVTGADLASALSAAGGFGTVHRFLSVDEQAAAVAAVADDGEQVGAAVGIAEDHHERAAANVEAGADCLMVDVAHGHLEKALAAVADLADSFPDVPLVAGNVATGEGVRDLASAGADCVKVGIGPGSHCTTREVAGAGVPQLTAVDDCAAAASEVGVTLVADGGIRSSGDATKALMAGADAVMMGSLFAGTAEAPGAVIETDAGAFKRSRGMATTRANTDRTDKDVEVDADEGVEGLTPYTGPVADVVDRFTAGVRSGLSYCGGHTIPEARANAEFVRVAASAREREGAHYDNDWESVSVADLAESEEVTRAEGGTAGDD